MTVQQMKAQILKDYKPIPLWFKLKLFLFPEPLTLNTQKWTHKDGKITATVNYRTIHYKGVERFVGWGLT